MNLREKLLKLINDYKIGAICDIPCGDFNWMVEVMNGLEKVNYMGGDIVAPLIEDNIEKYASENISFTIFDMTKDPFPKCDLLIVRDALVHLSFEDINLFLMNLSKNKPQYFLTTTHTTHIVDQMFSNKDIKAGEWRPIDIFKKPFSFPNRSLMDIDDWVIPHRPKKMCLFRGDDVPKSLSNQVSIFQRRG